MKDGIETDRETCETALSLNLVLSEIVHDLLEGFLFQFSGICQQLPLPAIFEVSCNPRRRQSIGTLDNIASADRQTSVGNKLTKSRLLFRAILINAVLPPLFSRPGRSQGLLYKQRCNYFIR